MTENTARRMQVRCCREPQKILGTLPVPRHATSTVCYWVPEPWADIRDYRTAGKQIELRIQPFHGPGLHVEGETELALVAEGVPLETLRKIRGFVEHGSNLANCLDPHPLRI